MIRTLEQNKRLYKLLGILNIDDVQKVELVEEVSKGRVSHSAELTVQECNSLLNHLQTIINNRNASDSTANKMRKKIMSIAHELGWETPSGSIDYERLKNWMLKYGYLHKELKDYSDGELPRLVTQFDNMLKKNYL
jgi:hypothetical protein